jgi:hypothetical protein
MTKRGVWEIIDEKDVPNDRRCIKNKWIFKMKKNGDFVQDLLRATTVTFLECTLLKALLLYLMM